jgi:hypothetical protein
VVGIELNASHLRPLRDGHLTATAVPARIGRTVQVWLISLTDDEGRAICAARCSLAVIDDPNEAPAVAPPVTPPTASPSPTETTTRPNPE